jgi:hypothetical protein
MEQESQYKHVSSAIQAIEDNIESIRQKLLEAGELWVDAESANITQKEP